MSVPCSYTDNECYWYHLTAAHAVLKYPREEYTTGRKLRCSPLYTRQEVAGAVFGETMAYERAMYFKVEDDSKCCLYFKVEDDSKCCLYFKVEDDSKCCLYFKVEDGG